MKNHEFVRDETHTTRLTVHEPNEPYPYHKLIAENMHEFCHIQLPDNIRLCRLVDAPETANDDLPLVYCVDDDFVVHSGSQHARLTRDQAKQVVAGLTEEIEMDWWKDVPETAAGERTWREFVKAVMAYAGRGSIPERTGIAFEVIAKEWMGIDEKGENNE
ncbi:MAG: hypothetical protein ACOYD4_06740 [Solirubrobacterales bacterium]